MTDPWVPYKLRTGKILYHINSVTGECRWTNQLKKINQRPQRRFDKICSMWNVKKLRWRDIRTQTEQGETMEGLTDNRRGLPSELSDGNGQIHATGASSPSVQCTQTLPTCTTDCQTSDACGSGSASHSLSLFHTLIQQVLDNQHTIYEKLQQIEGQMSQYDTVLMAQPSQKKTRGGAAPLSGVARKDAKRTTAPTVVWPAGTNVFMHSGAVNTEQKAGEKMLPAEKTNAKKAPQKKSTVSLELSQETLEELKKQAKSQINFSVKLMIKLTDSTERVGRAVYGNKNKQSLYPDAVSRIKKYYFHVYPSKNEEVEWAQCVTAMNLHLRKMKKAI